MDFKIEDFMISTGDLARFNYVCVMDNSENVEKLKAIGCTDEEIARMRNIEDDYLDVYEALLCRGYQFTLPEGFVKVNS